METHTIKYFGLGNAHYQYLRDCRVTFNPNVRNPEISIKAVYEDLSIYLLSQTYMFI